MLSAKNISKAFKKHLVLDSTTFSLPSNSIIGLCGRNGAGKTTLIKILLGIYSPDAGEVINNSRHQKVIFDIPPKLDYLKVRDFLNFFSLLYCDSPIQDSELYPLLERINLQAYANKKVSQLSYGMKKILYISTLLLGPTDLAFVDEPFNGLDPISLATVEGIFKQVREETGAIIVISSHLLNELSNICEHFLIIKDSIVRYVESVSEESPLIRLVFEGEADIQQILQDIGKTSNVGPFLYDIAITAGHRSSDIVRRLYENKIIFSQIYYLNIFDI